jgi:hypothetical protein
MDISGQMESWSGCIAVSGLEESGVDSKIVEAPSLDETSSVKVPG